MYRKLVVVVLITCACLLPKNVFGQQPVSVIPEPAEVELRPGYFYFKPTSYILVHDMAAFLDAVTFRDLCLKTYKLPLKTLREEAYPKNYIDVRYDSTLQLPDGAYVLDISEDIIRITGKNNGAVLNGLMSLLQLIENKFTNQYQVRCTRIVDHPRFPYRGMHLDCARHFFSVDEIKDYLDYLALFKMNYFHWHLTDDQGWRIEIKKYPLLTEKGSVRPGSMIGHYRDQKFDTIPYGGFYSQEEIKEIVKYAQRRNITVIPEIEIPGHCRAALAAYPQFGCKEDTTYSVGMAWGIYEEVFCLKDETFAFLQDVLTEVLSLFPSPFIHIGGDEVIKTHWNNCIHCKEFMEKHAIENADEAQAYFSNTIAEFLQTQGRTAIGWDEILTGDLSAEAVIMSWRGEEGGLAAARADRPAIMTPNAYCYFDYYQGEPASEPLAIGGYIPLNKVYHWEPVPAQLSLEESTYILGGQANLWTEYISDFDQVEYMLLPRLMALSEVLWSPSTSHNYETFLRKVRAAQPLLDQWNCNYSKSAFAFSAEVDHAENYDGLSVTLRSWNGTTGFDYQYEVDTIRSLFGGVYRTATYNEPILVKDLEFFNLKIPETDSTPSLFLPLRFNKATGKKITLQIPPSGTYPGKGGITLVDGIYGTVHPGWSAAHWLGYSGTNMLVTVDLGNMDTISAVRAGFLNEPHSWIYPPKAMEVMVSTDGKKYTTVGIVPVSATGTYTPVVYKFNPVPARFIQIQAMNFGTIEQDSPGAGHKAWLFVDEISVE